MNNFPSLNYHHLRYFWAVATEGNLTRVAKQLRVSQSALSSQIRLLEDQLGEPLFLRQSRRLVLTDAGRIAHAYAEEIFAAGGELQSTLKEGRQRDKVLRIGSVATLSRNFQDSFVAPLLDGETVRLKLVSGRLDQLLSRLGAHEVDLVLANQPARGQTGEVFRSHQIARQPVSLVSGPDLRTFRFPEDVGQVPLILPGSESAVRSSFDALCERLQLTVSIVAEVDDMAMMRLLARDMNAVALVPSVVVRDELQQGVLRECCEVPNLYEDFYAITVKRRYPHPLLRPLLSRSEAQILAME